MKGDIKRCLFVLGAKLVNNKKFYETCSRNCSLKACFWTLCGTCFIKIYMTTYFRSYVCMCVRMCVSSCDHQKLTFSFELCYFEFVTFGGLQVEYNVVICHWNQQFFPLYVCMTVKNTNCLDISVEEYLYFCLFIHICFKMV